MRARDAPLVLPRTCINDTCPVSLCCLWRRCVAANARPLPLFRCARLLLRECRHRPPNSVASAPSWRRTPCLTPSRKTNWRQTRLVAFWTRRLRRRKRWRATRAAPTGPCSGGESTRGRCDAAAASAGRGCTTCACVLLHAYSSVPTLVKASSSDYTSTRCGSRKRARACTQCTLAT